MTNSLRLHEAVLQLVEPLLAASGYELVDLELETGKKLVLRLFVDHLQGRDGISIEDCAKASRLVEPALDASELFPNAYVLEVSSPGVERPLRRDRDFVRFQGERIKVTIRDAAGARQTRSGRILGADESGFDLENQGEVLRVGYDQVDKANLEFTFGGPAKGSRGGHPTR